MCGERGGAQRQGVRPVGAVCGGDGARDATQLLMPHVRRMERVERMLWRSAPHIRQEIHPPPALAHPCRRNLPHLLPTYVCVCPR